MKNFTKKNEPETKGTMIAGPSTGPKGLDSDLLMNKENSQATPEQVLNTSKQNIHSGKTSK